MDKFIEITTVENAVLSINVSHITMVLDGDYVSRDARTSIFLDAKDWSDNNVCAIGTLIPYEEVMRLIRG